MKYQKSAKIANLNLPEPNVMSSNRFFCPNNSPKLCVCVFLGIHSAKCR